MANSLVFFQHDCGDYDVLIDDYGKSQFLTITRGVDDALIHIRDYYATLGSKLQPTGLAVTLSVHDWVQLVEQHDRISKGIEAQLSWDNVFTPTADDAPDAIIGKRLWYKINDCMDLTILPACDKSILGYDEFFGVRIVIGYKKRKQFYRQHVQLTPKAWSRIMFESNRMQIASIIMGVQKEISAMKHRKQSEHNMYNPSLFDKCSDLRKKIALIFQSAQNRPTDAAMYSACLDLTKL